MSSISLKPTVRFVSISILVLLAVCFVGCWYYSPYLAVRSLTNALEDGDKEAMSKFIDFPAVRFNIQKQVNNQIDVALAERSDGDHMTRTIDLYSFKLVDKLVKNLVSEEGIAALIQGDKKLTAVKPELPVQDAQKHAAEHSGEFTAESAYGPNMDQFNVVLEEKGRPNEKVSIELSREGFFFWRVTNVLLPFKP